MKQTINQQNKKIDFAFDMAIKYFDGCVKAFEDVQSKCLKFITLSIGVQTLILGYIAPKYDFLKSLGQNSPDVIIGLLILVILMIFTLLAVVNCYAPKDFHLPGNEPDNLINDKSQNISYYRLKEAELKAIQRRIKLNKTISTRVSKHLKSYMWLSAFLPVFMICVFIFAYNLDHFCHIAFVR
jgi:hypothetical protein